MRKNWLEIWYFCTNLVIFAIVETRYNKRKIIMIIITHNQECKNNHIYIYIYIERERERERERGYN